MRPRRPRKRFSDLASRGALLGAMMVAAGIVRADPGVRRWDGLSAFREDPGAPGQWRSPVAEASGAWDEVVVSWNAAPEVRLRVAVRAVDAGAVTPYFELGSWTGGPRPEYRTSAGSQRAAEGRVETDTVVFARPHRRFEVRLTLDAGRLEDIRHVALAGALSGDSAEEPPAYTAAWGRELDVPVESQAEYPEGIQSWCSPTSLTMLQGWWARQLGRTDLDEGVRRVAAGVHDPGWPGTGNWSFNVAHAGSHRGIAAVVARLGGVADLERWIADGKPVAVSVSYSRLKGAAEARAGDGHLVVVRGFTAEGDVVVNDPGVRRSRVRRVVRRADFIRAWAHSRRTAYLVWPESQPLPAGGDGRW